MPADCRKTRVPKRDFDKPSAIGERTALWSQQNSTDPGRFGANASALEVENADQREKAARGQIIYLNFAFKPLLQHPRTFIVNTSAAHIDRFDLAGR
jgi:hypothetical protein